MSVKYIDKNNKSLKNGDIIKLDHNHFTDQNIFVVTWMDENDNNNVVITHGTSLHCEVDYFHIQDYLGDNIPIEEREWEIIGNVYEYINNL